jgi:hypothetical protein
MPSFLLTFLLSFSREHSNTLLGVVESPLSVEIVQQIWTECESHALLVCAPMMIVGLFPYFYVLSFSVISFQVH